MNKSPEEPTSQIKTPRWTGEPGSWRETDPTAQMPTLPMATTETSPAKEAEELIRDFMSKPAYQKKEWPAWYNQYRANKIYDELGVAEEDRSHPELPIEKPVEYLPRREVRLKYAVLAKSAPLAIATRGLWNVIKSSPNLAYRTMSGKTEAEQIAQQEYKKQEKQSKRTLQAQRAAKNRQRWQNAKTGEPNLTLPNMNEAIRVKANRSRLAMARATTESANIAHKVAKYSSEKTKKAGVLGAKKALQGAQFTKELTKEAASATKEEITALGSFATALWVEDIPQAVRNIEAADQAYEDRPEDQKGFKHRAKHEAKMYAMNASEAGKSVKRAWQKRK